MKYFSRLSFICKLLLFIQHQLNFYINSFFQTINNYYFVRLRLELVRDWSWWYYFRAYFPLRLHKTAELPPARNYLFCVYPHGVLCSGAFGSFATNYSEFSTLFPGLTPYMLTINAAFNMPVTREVVLALGKKTNIEPYFCNPIALDYILKYKTYQYIYNQLFFVFVIL